jgi:uncharacterized protein with ParB-like and HNH nuclease domain
MTIFSRNFSTSGARALSFIIYSMEEGDFILNPEYQRDYVWDRGNQQDLMHSIFNNCPIGSIAIVENENDNSEGGYIEVVDGKQRITTIYKFYNNEFGYYSTEHEREIYWRDLNKLEQAQFSREVKISVNTLAGDITELEKWRYFYAVNFSGQAQSGSHREFVLNHIRQLENSQ